MSVELITSVQLIQRLGITIRKSHYPKIRKLLLVLQKKQSINQKYKIDFKYYNNYFIIIT